MTEEIFVKLKKAVENAYENPYSDFYRKHFKKNNFSPDLIKTPEDWQKVPVLTRENLATTGVFERIFIPYEEITILRTSSGTTGRDYFLVPRNKYRACEEFTAAGVSGVLSLAKYERSYWVKKPAGEKKIVWMSGDVHDMPRSAEIVKKLQLDGVLGTPSILIIFQPFLKKIEALDQVKAVFPQLEYCTPFQWEEISRLYPKAKKWQTYGNNETGALDFVPCVPDLYNHYHCTEEFFLEIMNTENTNICVPDEEGEIVVTIVVPDWAFPVIRYRTGDFGVVPSKNCSQKPGVYFKVLGRVNYDLLHLNGCEFNADRIAEVIKRVFNIGNPKFQMHFFENGGGYDILLQIENTEGGLALNFFSEETLLKNIRVGQNINLERALKNKLFKSFKIELVKEFDPDKKICRLKLHESPRIAK